MESVFCYAIWKTVLLDKLIATQVVSSMTIIEPDSLLFY